MSSDLILCTETRLLNDDDSDIQINQFSLITNNCPNNKFQSLAIYSKQRVCVIQDLNLDGFSVLTISHVVSKIKILLLYKAISLQSVFIETLRYLVISQNIDIVLADFNMKPEVLSPILDRFHQLVNESTHISGSILDQVYSKKSLFENFDITTKVKCVFFSDHDVA